MEPECESGTITPIAQTQGVGYITLRQADIGHQKHHTTSGPADYVHQTLLKLNFILLCCVQLLNIYALPFSIVYLT